MDRKNNARKSRLPMKTEMTKRFTFEAMHILPWHPGKCARPHGHSYKVEVTVEGKPNENGIIEDFDRLKEVFKGQIDRRLDHQDLNPIIENPTAERIATWILNEMRASWTACRYNGVISRVRVWETETGSVTVYADEV